MDSGAQKPTHALGIEVLEEDGLIIQAIGPGLVEEWNAQNPYNVVCAGDKIVRVNDSGGVANELTAALRQFGSLKIGLERCPESVQPQSARAGDDQDKMATLPQEKPPNMFQEDTAGFAEAPMPEWSPPPAPRGLSPEQQDTGTRSCTATSPSATDFREFLDSQGNEDCESGGHDVHVQIANPQDQEPIVVDGTWDQSSSPETGIDKLLFGRRAPERGSGDLRAAGMPWCCPARRPAFQIEDGPEWRPFVDAGREDTADDFLCQCKEVDFLSCGPKSSTPRIQARKQQARHPLSEPAPEPRPRRADLKAAPLRPPCIPPLPGIKNL